MCAARSSIHGAVPEHPEIGEGDRSGRGWGPGVVEVGEVKAPSRRAIPTRAPVAPGAGEEAGAG